MRVTILAHRGFTGFSAASRHSTTASPALVRSALALGRALRLRRKRLGLPQAVLARYAGCGLEFLAELESGKPTVRLDKVLAVLQVLGLTLTLELGREPFAVAISKSEDA